LHEIFDGKTQHILGHPVRIFFASGYDQKKLSEIGAAMDAGETVFTMSGDDSAISWGPLNAQKFGEADQSKFDHTQDDGPMKIFMGQILRHMGFPDGFIDLALFCCQCGFSFKKGRLYGKGLAGTQMPTGITTTTSFNSMSTFAFFVWTLHKLNETGVIDPVGSGRALGFDVKYKEFDSLNSITFLKGWWLDGPEGIQWVPLPSAVIKLGKVLRDPVEITAVKVKGKPKVILDKEEAIKRCAFALASSYGNIDYSYPILGKFVETLKRLCAETGPVSSLQESWKPVMTGIQVYRECALDAICYRYGLTADDIEDVENLLGRVNKLPAYVEHTVFDRLADEDY